MDRSEFFFMIESLLSFNYHRKNYVRCIKYNKLSQLWKSNKNFDRDKKEKTVYSLRRRYSDYRKGKSTLCKIAENRYQKNQKENVN